MAKFKQKIITNELEKIRAFFTIIKDNVGRVVKYCPKCLRQYGSNSNFCAYHKPKVELLKIENKSVKTESDEDVLKAFCDYVIENPEVMLNLDEMEIRNETLSNFKDVINPDILIDEGFFNKIFGNLRNKD